jgi:very-short-patch-repair endonuclease
MNGFGTVRTRPLPPGLLAAGWLDGNRGENLVVEALARADVHPAFGRDASLAECHQQHPVGPYTLDFAWPKLKIALEADGYVHRMKPQIARDRKRDAWLRANGWLVFRVSVESSAMATSQLARVLTVVRALTRTAASRGGTSQVVGDQTA